MTSTLVLSQAALVGLLNRTIPFAAKEADFPTWCAIELEADGFGYLTATSCDRIRLAHARTKMEAEWATDVEPFKFLMPLRDAREIVKLFSPARTRGYVPGPDTTLTFEDEVKPTLTIAGPGVRNDGSRLSMTLEGLDGAFIKWRGLLNGVVTGERTPGPFMVNPHYLADFECVATSNTPIRVTVSAPDRPVLIEAEDFVGMLMPVKSYGSSLGFEVLTGDEIRIGVVLTPPKAKRAAKQVAA